MAFANFDPIHEFAKPFGKQDHKRQSRIHLKAKTPRVGFEVEIFMHKIPFKLATFVLFI